MSDIVTTLTALHGKARSQRRNSPVTAIEPGLLADALDEAASVVTALQEEITTLRGAMKADDERLRNAGERVGIFADCDTAEMMADEIMALRAALADERKRALEEAADLINEFAVGMGRIAEHRKAGRQLAQAAAIDTLEVVETLVRALKEATK